MLDATPVDLADGAPILSKSIEVIRIAPNHAVYLRGRRLHRVFNDGVFSLGGRMYGHWVQSLPKSLRADLILDGEPTFELDYGQTHPRMLAAEMGINLGAGDIYAIDGWPRQQIKIATNIAINAKTYDSAIRAITREIGGRGACSGRS